MEPTTVFDIVMGLLDNKRYQELKIIMEQMNPADIALILDEAEEKSALTLFRLLPKELASETFAYIETEQQEQLISAFSDRELRAVVNELFLDDTVDLIEEMPASVVARILKKTDSETRKQINELLAYPDDSAGSLMTLEYVYFNQDTTVSEAFERIRQVGVAKETIYTCYVTERRRLVGVVSLLDMLTAETDTSIREIMDPNVISVTTLEDKEHVAAAFAKYDLLALPVVDMDNRLVGIVTVDDAIDVIQEETTEDIEIMAAIAPTDKTYFRTGIFETFLSRIPWLLLLMLSATFTGMIITSFEDKLAACVVLTSFMPMLMGTGGNAGGQASATIIRGLSLGDIELRDIFRTVWKEIRVAVICGGVLAIVNFGKMMLVDRLLLGNPEVTTEVALVVCLTLVVTVFVAKFIGCILPILAKAIKLDPAVMASPFITTIVDAISLMAYFFIAQSLLGI